YKELKKLKLISDNLKIRVETSRIKPKKRNALMVVKYDILFSKKYDEIKLNKEIIKLINKQPLSKFGIEPKFSFTNNIAEFESKIKQKYLYYYTDKATHHFVGKIATSDIEKNETGVIFSNIKVSLNEDDNA